MKKHTYTLDQIEQAAAHGCPMLGGAVDSGSSDAKRLLHQVIDTKLTDRQRECLQMYFYRRMTVEAIARECGLHKSTVSRHISAAKAKIACALAPFYP